ncbi:MAG: molecular chaperone HtpG [Vicinamibacterales bacterium]
MTTDTEVFEFQAQTRELLGLVIHSLYTQKEIFLRELVSNASDALDRLRFEAMLHPELMAEGYTPRVVLQRDTAERTLTIADNGIGMTRSDVVANIGTIARSGTKELLERIARGDTRGAPELIGRFGVGFYSAFMVAEDVSLVSRHASEQQATRWESRGDGEYTIGAAERAEPGTTITLRLKAVDHDAGIEDYTDQWVLSRIIRRYSDFVAYPIVLAGVPRDEPMFAGPPSPDTSTTAVVLEDRVLNSQKPVWSKPPAEVSDEEYNACYRQLTHDWNPPVLRLLARAEGRIECQALVFVPAEAGHDLFYHAVPYGLQLYAKRVLVVDECADVLPRYLRFVRGVLDVLDLPLHVSRQMLQERSQIERIQKWLTRKVLDRLDEVRQTDAETYLKIWRQFGRVLKEGLGPDHENKDRLLALFLFESSHQATELTSLAAYVERMPADQQHIYFLSGDSREAIEHAPHLESARARGFEVLYLTEPVDDLLVQALPEFGGKRLKSLGQGALDLGAPADEGEPAAADVSALAARLQELLTAHVKSVRASTRLTTSPACLTGEEYEYSPRMERLLLKGKGGGPRQRRILELNPRHPLIQRLCERLAAEQDPEGLPWDDCAQLLLGYALLAEGSEPFNAVRFGQALSELMRRSL